uniref:Uncharacterized protein n=1 Tax=Megaselia scalaris TaxID=36166 RepID=T1GKI5_MEGSC
MDGQSEKNEFFVQKFHLRGDPFKVKNLNFSGVILSMRKIKEKLYRDMPTIIRTSFSAQNF